MRASQRRRLRLRLELRFAQWFRRRCRGSRRRNRGRRRSQSRGRRRNCRWNRCWNSRLRLLALRLGRHRPRLRLRLRPRFGVRPVDRLALRLGAFARRRCRLLVRLCLRLGLQRRPCLSLLAGFRFHFSIFHPALLRLLRPRLRLLLRLRLRRQPLRRQPRLDQRRFGARHVVRLQAPSARRRHSRRQHVQLHAAVPRQPGLRHALHIRRRHRAVLRQRLAQVMRISLIQFILRQQLRAALRPERAKDVAGFKRDLGAAQLLGGQPVQRNVGDGVAHQPLGLGQRIRARLRQNHLHFKQIHIAPPLRPGGVLRRQRLVARQLLVQPAGLAARQRFRKHIQGIGIRVRRRRHAPCHMEGRRLAKFFLLRPIDMRILRCLAERLVLRLRALLDAAQLLARKCARLGLVQVAHQHQHDVVRRVPLLPERLERLERRLAQVARIANRGVPQRKCRESKLFELEFGGRIGLVLVALAPLFQHRLALGLPVRGVDLEVREALRLQPQRQLQRWLGHDLVEVRAIRRRVGVEHRADGFQILEMLHLSDLVGALEHHVLEEVRQPGQAGLLVARADIDHEADGDQRRGAVGLHHDAHAVVERKARQLQRFWQRPRLLRRGSRRGRRRLPGEGWRRQQRGEHGQQQAGALRGAGKERRGTRVGHALALRWRRAERYTGDRGGA